jgi:Lrp/AsnC family transcriptional regulator for asnA, asnC and gidA
MLTRTIFNEAGLPDLEPADRALVDRLVADPRASGRDLAKALDCSEANISRRLSRLIAEHAVRIRAFMPLDRAGLSASAVMLVKSPDPEALGRRLASLDWLHFIATTGPIDGPADGLVAHGSVVNGTALRALIDRDLGGDPLAPVVDVRLVLDSFGTQETSESHRHHWRGGRPLDRVNRAIIRELQRDGRATFATLGEVAGISSTAAAERFRHLIDDQLIRMLAFPEPSRIGMRASGCVFIRSSVTTDEACAAATVVANPRFVAMVSGPNPVVMEMCAADGRALQALAERVGALPGITDIDLLPYHAILKESFVWCGAEEA